MMFGTNAPMSSTSSNMTCVGHTDHEFCFLSLLYIFQERSQEEWYKIISWDYVFHICTEHNQNGITIWSKVHHNLLHAHMQRIFS